MTQENWEENGVVSDFVTFNKVGDFIKGVWIEAYTPDKVDKFGKKERKLSIRATEGKWHGPDGAEVIAEVGETYRVSEKSAIAAQLKKSVIGQYLMFKLTELRKSDKGNPAKIITVLSKKDGEGRPVVDKDFSSEAQYDEEADVEKAVENF